MYDPRASGSGLAAAISALSAVAGPHAPEWLSAVADRFGGVAFELDNEGRIVRSVGAFRRGAGPPRCSGADQRLVSDLFGDVPDLLAAVRRALGGECVELDVDIDGALFAVEYAPLLGGDGTVTRVVGFATLREAPQAEAPPDGRGAL